MLRSIRVISAGVLITLAACSENQSAAPSEKSQATAPTQAVSQQQKGAGDYFAPDTPARAKQLVAEAKAKPTDAATLKARAATLWVWANACAIKGIPLSPDLSSTLGRIAALPTPTPASPEIAAVSRQLDYWIEELGVRDANPKAVGSVTSPNTGPFPVASLQTLDQVYTVGDLPIQAGGGLLISSDLIKFQVANGNAEGFTTATASNSNARFSAEMIALDNPLALRRPRPMAFFKLTDGTLKKGDSVTLRLGDHGSGSAESAGVKLPTVAMANLGVQVWVRLKADGPLFPLNHVAFKTEGLETAGVRGFAPSIVAVNERVRIAVRSEDQYRNRATAAFPKYKIAANGTDLGEVSNQNVAINHLETTFATPGVYRVAITSDDGFVTGEVNPILVVASPTQRINWGEVQDSAGEANDADSLEAYFRFAREDAKLDFAALSDVDLNLDDAAWERMRAAVIKQRRIGEFEPYLGDIWSGATGSRLVLYRAPENHRRVDIQRAATEVAFAAAVAKEGPANTLLVPLAAATATIPSDAAAAAIINNQGVYGWFAERLMSQGARVGFVAGSNGRFGKPSRHGFSEDSMESQDALTAIVTNQGGRDGIYDGLKRGATYATNGHRIILDVSVNGRTLGMKSPRATQQEFSGQVVGTAPIESIQVFKNGRLVQSDSFSADDGAAGTVELSFASASDFGESKRWHGFAQIKGARLVAVASTNSQNTLFEKAALDDNDPTKLNFTLRSLGFARTVRMTVDGISAGSELMLQVDSVAAPLQRSFKFAELATAQTVSIEGGGTLTVRRVRPAAEGEQFFHFVDSEPKANDSYFLRVETADGGIAYSSPIWVEADTAAPR